MTNVSLSFNDRCSFRASLFTLLLALSLASVAVAAPVETRPNILIIIADDLGFADLGAFGGEIRTPNLDALAYGGLRLTDFQASSACSPTRAMLFTGADNHLVGFGNLTEELAPNQRGAPGYEGYLNERSVSLATLMQDAGYNTYISGKWHLGGEVGQGPGGNGFKRSFVQLKGASHFADMQPSYAPDPESKAGFLANDVRLDSLPASYRYSSQFFADNLVNYLASDAKDNKPFFAVLSFTAPHWPLQLPDDKLDLYAGQYDVGYDVLYEQRLSRMIELGLIQRPELLPARPPKAVPWSSLDDAQRKTEARAMEIYAGMVEVMDDYTGRVVQYLESTGQLENTLVIFLSDNGAEGHDMDDTWPADKFPKIRSVIDERFDFSYANMGRPNSYTLYGPGWGRAGAPHLHMYKGFSSEGGTRVAAFVSLPGMPGKGRIEHGMVSVKDIAPTVLDYAGIERHRGEYQGRKVVPMTGTSLRALLERGEEMPERELGMELIGKYAYRAGPWKMTVMPPPYGTGQPRLYNLDADPGERRDLADEEPEKLRAMVAGWRQYQQDNGVILPDWLSGY